MAKVLTGISGNLISAASAGFAPTNSADVSAIASSYQVVSSTATQLYAGTAYVTSVNDAPLSASRAGNAANASMATSAYYDGTGRLISALPDSAAVSSIASAYAESAASGKQDELTFSYDDDKISAINGSAIAGGAGGGMVTAIGSLDGHVTSINSSDIVGRPSAVMTRSADENTLQADEWMSMGQSTIEGRSFSYSLGINKLYLVPNHTSNDMSATAYDNDYNLVGVVPLTATSCTISSDTAVITKVDAQSDENGLSMYVSGFKYTPSGDYIVALPSTESCVLKSDMSVALGHDLTAASGDYAIAFVQGNDASAGDGGFAFGYMASAENGIAFGTSVAGKMSSIANGYNVSAHENSIANGYYATADNNGLAVGGNVSALNRSFANGTNVSAVDLSLAQGQDVSAVWTSMAQGYGATASSNSFARGVFVSAINSATVIGQNNLSGDGSDSSGAAFVIGDGTEPYYRHDLMVVTKDGEITMYSGTADTTGTGIMSSIRALSANAGGVDSATVSAIASSYAESAVSGKADSSALSSYALSADVSGTVDLVSTQSANWGGSALALSAGPGVKLEKSGNVLVASTDETVLWTGSVTSGNSATLSEPITNYEYIVINGHSHNGTKYCVRMVGPVLSSEMYLVQPTYWPNSTEIDFVRAYCSGDKVRCDGTLIRYGGNDATNNATLVKVVGINRTAEA